MDIYKILGPRYVDCVKQGNKIIGSREVVFREGGYGVVSKSRIYDVEVGRLSGRPFDNTVRDVLGRKIGEFEDGPAGPNIRRY